MGGWCGVEIAKRAVSERQVLGDEFASILPIGIGIGRFSCLVHGCCPGRAVADVLPESLATGFQRIGFEFWPAPIVEIAFQSIFWLACISTRNVSWLKGQKFHLYLITYGMFRATHEHFRDTVRYEATNISPYMVLGLIVAMTGAIAFAARHYKLNSKT